MKSNVSRLNYVHVALLGVTAIYIFYFQFLPYEDLPEWIYHGHVFNQIVFHHNNFGGFFWFHHYIPPNASATVLIGLFELVVSPIIAGKIFLLLCCTLVYFGTFFLFTVLTKSRHSMFALISFMGAFNLYFCMGLMNFVFGLGVALLGTYYVLIRREKSNVWTLAGLFLLCYCSHFASLLVLLVPVLSVLLYTRDKMLFRRTLIASIPIVFLTIHYYFSKEILTFSSSGILQGSYFETIWNTIIYSPALLMPFHRVKHVYEPGLFENIINYAFAIVLHCGALIFLYRTIIRRERSLLAISGVITYVLLVFSPQYLGGLFNLGERFEYLFYIILFAYLFLLFSKPWMRISLTCFSLFVAMATIGSAWYSAEQFNSMDIPKYARQFSDYDPHGGSNPFYHHHFYDDILQNRGVPIFHHGLFNYPGAENSKPFDQ